MIDLLHLPKPVSGNTDYFIGKSATLGGTWEIWEKPRGINMIRITCIGGGGGGGGGLLLQPPTQEVVEVEEDLVESLTFKFLQFFYLTVYMFLQV